MILGLGETKTEVHTHTVFKVATFLACFLKGERKQGGEQQGGGFGFV